MNRSFGVEIECDHYLGDHSYANWNSHYEHCGTEFVSPILQGEDGLRDVRSFYKAVRPIMSDSCGLHVHVDVRDFTGEEKLELVKRLKAEKELFYSKVDKKRHNNIYCHRDIPAPYRNDDWYSYKGRVSTDRFCWVNLNAIRRHGSVEFRLHEATENVGKVCAWVRFLTEFVESVKTGCSVSECPACVDKAFIRSQVDMLVSGGWSDSTFQRAGLR